MPRPPHRIAVAGLALALLGLVALLLGISSVTQPREDLRTSPLDEAPGPVAISLSERTVTQKVLQLQYQIQNGSDKDIWICESMDLRSRWGDVEVYVGQDSETLFIQRGQVSLCDESELQG